MTTKMGARYHKILKILCFSLFSSALIAAPLLISSCSKNKTNTKIHVSVVQQPTDIKGAMNYTNLIISYPSCFVEYSLISCVFSNSDHFYTTNTTHSSNTIDFTIQASFRGGETESTNITLEYSGTSFEVTFDSVNSISAHC